MLSSTHTHTRPTICTLTHSHVPAWELQDDVMLGRPTRACGETQYMWGTSPFPCRPLTSPPPPPHILPWSPVGPEGTLAADGASISHILCGQIWLHQQQLWLRDPKLPDALQAGLSPSKSAQDRLGNEFRCNSIYWKEESWEIEASQKVSVSSFEGQDISVWVFFSVCHDREVFRSFKKRSI